MLVASAILAGRGSGRAHLVWLGVLVYLIYSYIIYALSVQFNPLFLVYVALLGCSLYALIGGSRPRTSPASRHGSRGECPQGL